MVKLGLVSLVAVYIYIYIYIVCFYKTEKLNNYINRLQT